MGILKQILLDARETETLRVELEKVKRERDEALAKAKRIQRVCESVHDRILRGDDDITLLNMLTDGWQDATGKTPKLVA